MEYGMVVNYAYCTNCHSCDISCKKEKGFTKEEWGIKVLTLGPARFGSSDWEWDYVPVPSSLCDMCESRLQEGKVPLCQLHCLASVIQVLPVDQIDEAMRQPQGKTAVYLRN